MQHECSLPRPQEPSTVSYPETKESNRYRPDFLSLVRSFPKPCVTFRNRIQFTARICPLRSNPKFEEQFLSALSDFLFSIFVTTLLTFSRDRVVDGNWLRLDDREFRVRVPEGQEFTLLHVVQTGSGVHPTSYPMGTGGPFPGGKAAGAWSWPLTSN
jgi:hypothetical protein